MKLKINQDFAYTHRGYERREYAAGEVVDVDDQEMIDVATGEGWAAPADEPAQKEPPDQGTPPEGKAKKAAPENKAKG